MKDELFQDIKAAERFGTSLAVTQESPAPRVVAAERGRRQHPNGVVEDYERIEFESPEA